MIVRIGKVTNTYPGSGKVKVLYEDLNEASVALPMLTFNNEYKMPNIGDRVLTLHLENGSSKGFVLGTYWSQNNMPNETGSGLYRKNFGGGAFAKCANGELRLYGPSFVLQSSAGAVDITTILAALQRITKLEDTVSKQAKAIEKLQSDVEELKEV